MMRESLLKLVQFASIMLYVLVAGVMWGTWLSLARTMTSYDAATFLADGQHMIESGDSDGGADDLRCTRRCGRCGAAVWSRSTVAGWLALADCC